MSRSIHISIYNHKTLKTHLSSNVQLEKKAMSLNKRVKNFYFNFLCVIPNQNNVVSNQQKSQL